MLWMDSFDRNPFPKPRRRDRKHPNPSFPRLRSPVKPGYTRALTPVWPESAALAARWQANGTTSGESREAVVVDRKLRLCSTVVIHCSFKGNWSNRAPAMKTCRADPAQSAPVARNTMSSSRLIRYFFRLRRPAWIFFFAIRHLLPRTLESNMESDSPLFLNTIQCR